MFRRVGSMMVLVLAACPSEESDSGTTEAAETHADSHDEHGTESSGSTSSSSTSGSEVSSGTTSSSSSSSSSGSGSMSTGTAADTWENWALPSFFEVYCNQCHPAAGQSKRDFSDYDTVMANFEHIRCGVAPELIEGCDGHIEPGHLPIGPGPYPSDDERWRLVEWLDAGMPRD